MRQIAIACFYGTIASSAGIALTATSGWLIVRASEQPIMLTLLTAIVAVRAFGMARPFFRYLERLASHNAALSDLANRRTDAYRSLIPLTPARLGRSARSDVLAGVVDDLTEVAEAPARAWVPALSGALSAIGAAVLAALFLPAAGLLMLGYVTAVAALTWWALRGERVIEPACAEAQRRVAEVTDQAAWQAVEVSAIGASKALAAELATAHTNLDEATRRQARVRARLVAGLVANTAGGTAGMAWLVLTQGLATGLLSAPIAALLVLLPVAVGEAISGLPDTVRAFARAEAAEQRMSRLLSQDPAVDSTGEAQVPADADAPSIQLSDAQASWTSASASNTDPATPSLQLPAFRLTHGTHLAVRGPNGCGKSTLMAVLARHLDRSAGDHTINGRDVGELSMAHTRELFAISGDEPHVFNASLAENLRVAAPEASDEQMIDALVVVGLKPLLDTLPEGLETRLGLGGHTPSAGERARLALARAVISRRHVLLLDEPTAHLDRGTAAEVMERLRAVAQGKSLVLVTHRREDLEHFADILELDAPRATPTRRSDHARRPIIADAAW
ncbi:thiol reductant ABC exporter subunit CydC [Ornithinimicrobium sp. Arc0846-15]|nr:thiol reductant ABC exporter subunit CydC [Ornithinimicrobium laminariae]